MQGRMKRVVLTGLAVIALAAVALGWVRWQAKPLVLECSGRTFYFREGTWDDIKYEETTPFILQLNAARDEARYHLNLLDTVVMPVQEENLIYIGELPINRVINGKKIDNLYLMLNRANSRVETYVSGGKDGTDAQLLFSGECKPTNVKF